MLCIRFLYEFVHSEWLTAGDQSVLVNVKKNMNYIQECNKQSIEIYIYIVCGMKHHVHLHIVIFLKLSEQICIDIAQILLGNPAVVLKSSLFI